jgi:DNA repair photolyase
MKVIERVENDQLKLLAFKRKYSDTFYLSGPEYYHLCDFRCVYCITESQGKASSLFDPADIPAILDKELALLESPIEYTHFVLNPASDPYIPIEKELGITRILIEEFNKRKLHYTFCTKGGELLKRDADLLAEAGDLAKPIISLSTTNSEALRKLEPQAPSPDERLDALAYLAERGVNICLSISPWIPNLSDTENLLARVPEGVFVYVQPLDLGHAFEETFDKRRKQFSAFSVFGKQFTTSELNKMYVAECNRIGKRENMEWRYPITEEFREAEHLYLKQLIPGKYSPDDF